MVGSQTIACPVEPEPGHPVQAQSYFDAFSDLSAEEVRLALDHFRHWAGHHLGAHSQLVLAEMERRHDELHVLVAGAGWSEGVVVFVAGTFFDTDVDCAERWGLEPMARLAEQSRWSVAFELHRHGEHMSSATPGLNCDMLNLATHYGGFVTARAVGYDGAPGPELGTWAVSADGVTRILAEA